MRSALGFAVSSLVITSFLTQCAAPLVTVPRLPESVHFGTWVVYWDSNNSLEAARSHVSQLKEISVFAASFDESSRLVSPPWADHALRELRGATTSGHGPRLLITAVNDVISQKGNRLKDPDIIHEILSSPEKRGIHVQQLLKLSEGADGIEIDYEALKLKDRDAFTKFIAELADRLHQSSKTLTVVVEPKTKDVLKDKEGAIDWKAVAEHADGVKVMAYLYHYPSGEPGPVAPADWVVEVAQFALTQVPAEKLWIALTMNGCDWPSNGRGKTIVYKNALFAEQSSRARRRYDSSSDSPYLRYKDKGIAREAWFEDKRSLREKTARLASIGILNIALWHIGSGDPDYWIN